ncbi:MAG: hypothetical protein AAB453_00575 [Patescibacteria group bacterium]
MSSVTPPVTPIIPGLGVRPKKSNGLLYFLIILLILVILGGATAFAYTQQLWIFKPSFITYPKETFASSLLAKISEIESSSYKISSRLNVGPRDARAKPFELGKNLDPVLVANYQDDYERVQTLRQVLDLLKQSVVKKTNTAKTYPTELSLASDLAKKSPLLKGDYQYQTTENGKNFLLSATFDTDQAIAQLNRYDVFGSTTPIIVEGKTIKFTKDTSTYLAINSDLPKPFLVSMTDSLKLIPADVDFLGEFNMATEKSLDNLTNWLFGFNIEGKMSDLSYKINAEALRKNGNYYFKVNNVPSLFFLGELATIKGQWVKVIDKNATSSDENGFSLFSEVAKGLPEFEKKYKERRAEVFALLKKIVEIADQKQVIVFKGEPKAEKINGQNLFRYDIGIKKESVLPFIERVTEEVAKSPSSGELRGVSVIDTAWLTYLGSEEFNEVFDYLDQNIKLSFWTDKAGFPIILEESLRLVPPESATQLAGKQINLVFRTVLSDVNIPIKIDEPTNAKSLEEVMKNSAGDFNL